MLRNISLRFRVATFFAGFGALLSVLLSGAIYVTALELGHRLMDETLRAELEDSVARHSRNPSFVPPNTVSIKGYVLSDIETGQNIPDSIKSLPIGIHSVLVKEIDYRVLVADRNGSRYFMLFDTDKQHKREAKFFRFLSVFAFLMTIVSAGGGFWLAISIISPVTRLARQVTQAEPDDVNLSLTRLTRNDEVGELARAFDRYLRRLREFTQRESYFTADVSHELRTPLAIILGTVEVLEQDPTLSIKQKERMFRIKRAVQDMIEMTNALLLMSREHIPSADEQSCRIGEVLRSSIEKHLHLIGDRAIRMDIELAAEPNLQVERALLEVVIGNLIRNALFNTNTGSVLLRLEADRLIVRDSGIGMRPVELEHALDRFYKGPSSAGAGVGLSLVKRICDRYGWQISLVSQEGHGTTAEIIFTAK